MTGIKRKDLLSAPDYELVMEEVARAAGSVGGIKGCVYGDRILCDTAGSSGIP